MTELTTDRVRFAYVDRRVFEDQILGYEVLDDEEYEADFNKWLRELKAEVWNEGYAASKMMLPTDPPKYPTNPYRSH